MSITTTVKKAEVGNQTREYPWIGRPPNSELIVLFTNYNCGVTLKGSHVYKTGLYRETWNEAFFTPFKGKITIKVD